MNATITSEREHGQPERPASAPAPCAHRPPSLCSRPVCLSLTSPQIFYQLCAGATPEQKKKYHLSTAATYNYLNQSGNYTIDGVDDSSDFREVDEAMDGLNFTAEEKHNIFSIVAWILHVGNLRFEPSGDKKCSIENKAECLKQAAALMEVDEEALVRAITNRVMVVRGQAPMDISLSVQEAQSARDALSKFVFARLFDWLVVRINKSIGIGAGKKGRSIGILDIFGFEIFVLNSFEQLCINFGQRTHRACVCAQCCGRQQGSVACSSGLGASIAR